MTNAKPMKVGEIAKQLAVTPNTVRNWCRRYAAHLSDTANPASGGERLFDTRDVNVLTYIHGCMQEAMNHDEIAVRLGEKTFNVQEVDIIVADAPQPPESPQEAPQDALMLPMVLGAMDKRIEALERESARLVAVEQRLDEQAREARAARRDSFLLVAVGVVIGVVVIIALQLLVLGMEPLW